MTVTNNNNIQIIEPTVPTSGASATSHESNKTITCYNSAEWNSTKLHQTTE